MRVTNLFAEEEARSVTAQDLDAIDSESVDTPAPEVAVEKLPSQDISEKQIKRILESLLFVALQPIQIEQLHDSIGIDLLKIRRGLEELQVEFHERASGLMLSEVAGGWQLRTAPETADYVRRFLRVKPQRLTRAAVETLAIVAYQQPVTRPEIEDIRGVDSGAVLKALLERRLIQIVGKKDDLGRPMLYGTTREFLEFFALKNINALPTLREFHELTEESREIIEKVAPDTIAEELLKPPPGDRNAKGESESVLEELEQAMQYADMATKSTQRVFNAPNNVTTIKPEE